MKSGSVTLKQVTQVKLTADINIFDLVDTDNFYIRLEERRNIVTSLLEEHKVIKGDPIYNVTLNNFNYQWIRDLVASNFHDLSQDIELKEFTPLQLRKTDEEMQQIFIGIFYLALDDLLLKHLTIHINNNNSISEDNCLATASCLAEIEKLGLALGLPKISDEFLKNRQSTTGKKKKGSVGVLKHAVERICRNIGSISFQDFKETVSPDEDGTWSETVEDLYSAIENPINIHHIQIEDGLFKFGRRDGVDDNRSITTIRNILSKIKL